MLTLDPVSMMMGKILEERLNLSESVRSVKRELSKLWVQVATLLNGVMP